MGLEVSHPRREEIGVNKAPGIRAVCGIACIGSVFTERNDARYQCRRKASPRSLEGSRP
jgi:hypothetical protein